MNRTIVIMFVLATALTTSFCQSIELKKSFGTYQFYQGNKRLTLPQVAKQMEPNAQAYEVIKKARVNYNLAMILGFSGGALIGFPLGTAAGGGEPEWAMAGVGAVLVAICIPVNMKFNRQAEKAVELYNGGLSLNHYRPKPEL